MNIGILTVPHVQGIEDCSTSLFVAELEDLEGARHPIYQQHPAINSINTQVAKLEIIKGTSST